MSKVYEVKFSSPHFFIKNARWIIGNVPGVIVPVNVAELVSIFETSTFETIGLIISCVKKLTSSPKKNPWLVLEILYMYN